MTFLQFPKQDNLMLYRLQWHIWTQYICFPISNSKWWGLKTCSSSNGHSRDVSKMSQSSWTPMLKCTWALSLCLHRNCWWGELLGSGLKVRSLPKQKTVASLRTHNLAAGILGTSIFYLQSMQMSNRCVISISRFRDSDLTWAQVRVEAFPL